MKTSLIIFLAVLIGASLTACSSAPKQVEYKQQALEITLKADPKLNLYQGIPHTLLVCLYELKDPNAFNQLVEETDGMAKIMECNRFDGTVAFVKRVVVQPGQETKEVLDCAEGAKYLAVAAGYYVTQKQKAQRPISILRIPSGKMKATINLGPQSILNGGK